MHIWLLIDRLNKINTPYSKYQAKDLEYKLKLFTLEKINRIHLRKKNDFIKDVNFFMTATRRAFN
jgi:hypothetical protein